MPQSTVPPKSPPQVTAGGTALVLAYAAIGFALLAAPGGLVWLTIWVPALGVPNEGVLSLLANLVTIPTAIISWILALACSVTAGATLIHRRGGRRARIALVLGGPGAVLGTIMVVAVTVQLGSSLGLFATNAAKDSAAAITRQYTDHDATLICDNGDSGYGPDNRQPWYSAYLEAPANIDSDEVARRALADAGFGTATSTAPNPGYDEPAPEGSRAWATSASGRSATVAIYPTGTLPLYCTNHGVTYGEQRTPDTGRVLITIEVSLPTRA